MKKLGCIMIVSILFFLTSVTYAERNVEGAISWAEGELDDAGWSGLCFIFVRSAFDEESVPGIVHAIDAWRYDNVGVFDKRQSSGIASHGALVFFYGDKVSSSGHVGVSIGDGKMIHAWTSKVEESDIDDDKWKEYYLGWRWPDGWTNDSPSTQIEIRIVGGIGWYPTNKPCIRATHWYGIKNGQPVMTYGSNSACYSAGTGYITNYQFKQ